MNNLSEEKHQMDDTLSIEQLELLEIAHLKNEEQKTIEKAMNSGFTWRDIKNKVNLLLKILKE